MNVDVLINLEADYFKPMHTRESSVSEGEKVRWHHETVGQRRERVSTEVFEMFDGRVAYGPFRGLKISANPWWGKSDLGSMVLGLYEKEILEIIEALKNKRGQIDSFIDIGAADGYYASGMLMSQMAKRAICFESSEEGRSVIRENWVANGSPGLLEIHGEARVDSMKAIEDVDMSNCFVLIDIEGGEFDLLSESFLGKLCGATVVVEIHNWVGSFLERYSKMLRAIDKYFDIELVERVERPTACIPELRDFTDDNRLLLVSERRPCLMRFLKLLPR